MPNEGKSGRYEIEEQLGREGSRARDLHALGCRLRLLGFATAVLLSLRSDSGDRHALGYLALVAVSQDWETELVVAPGLAFLLFAQRALL